MQRLPAFLLISFVLAALGLAPWLIFPLTRDQGLSDDVLLLAVYALGPVWLVLASFVLWRYRRRRFWVLLGMPFALSADAWYLLLIAACSTGHGCL